MDYQSSFRISAAGMSLEKARVDVTAQNIAHMHVARAADGSMYQPARVVAKAGQSAVFGASYENAQQNLLSGPQNVTTEATLAAPRLVHEPGHPQADEKGFVAYPGVNHSSEMVNLVSALRAYEANVVAMNAAKTMALKALELGGNS
jgi:flagellar basal-body rod protein FlgC